MIVLTVTAHELRTMLRDRRLRWSAALIFLLLAVAVLAGWTHYRGSRAEHERAQRVVREQWLGQGARDAHSGAHYGTWAFRTLPPLSVIDPGVDAYTGTAVLLQAHRRAHLQYRAVENSRALRRLGDLTAATVLQLLIPLVVFALMFDTLAGERERGTLRQAFSLGVAPRSLAAGKALGVAGALTALLAPAIVLGTAALALTTGREAMTVSLPRLFGLGAGYLLFYIALMALALAVSAAARSSRTALLLLLGFWVTSSFVVPRAAADLSHMLHPMPSAVALVRQTEHAVPIHGAGAVHARSTRVGDAATAGLHAPEEYANRVFEEAHATVDRAIENQLWVQQAAGLVSPLLSVRFVSMGFAGTDHAHHRHFAGAAEDYRRRLVRTMNEEALRQFVEHWAPRPVGEDVWRKVPDFVYVPPGVRWALAPNLAIMAGWVVVSLVAAVVTVGRLGRHPEAAGG